MINEKKFSDVIGENFTRYAGAVILDRAICDVRDMLKPSARKLLYSQHREKNNSHKAFVKSLGVVGSATRSFYTHGDSSCYSTYMRMAKPFAMRYPLEECQGNYGTVVLPNDEAASRYTELRLSPVTDYIFADLNKASVKKWMPNFDDTLEFPSVLPSIGFYNIVNGTLGLGIAISSSVPQFNLKEVNEAIIRLINNPNATFEELYCAPDFATGGTIVNASEVRESLRNGHGKACRIRGKIEYDAASNSLLITELPYGVLTSTIKHQIEEVLEENDAYGISGINDGSEDTVNFQISLAKDVNPATIIKKLYRDTSLEDFYTINMTMLDRGRFPKVFTWKEALSAYIEHITECKRNQLQYEEEQLKARNHVLDGLLVAIAHIDEVIETIRNSDSAFDATSNLIAAFGFDAEQCKAILDIKLQRLAKLEAVKINKERENNCVEIDRLNTILNSPSELNALLIAALREVASKFGDARRTRMMNLSDEIDDIEEEEVFLTYTDTSIKVIKKTVKDCLKTTNLSTLVLITQDGKLYHAPVSAVLEAGTIKFSTLCNVAAPVVYVGDLNNIQINKYWMFATEQGMIKKSAVDEYTYNGRNGNKVLKLKNDDKIVSCGVFTSDTETFSVIRKERAPIGLSVGIVNVTGKAAIGSKIFKE